jgi:U3 small nucleolar ribonucleoprotein protein IMP4
LKQDAEDIRRELAYDEHNESAELSTHIDDEYATAGVTDPKILITTSRDPSSRLLMFSKELRLIFPNSQRINRGGYVSKDIVDACKANEVTDLIIVCCVGDAF